MVLDPSIPEALRVALAAAVDELAKDVAGADGASGEAGPKRRSGFGLDLSATVGEVVRGSTTSPVLAALALTVPAFDETTVAASLEALDWRDDDPVVLVPTGSPSEAELAALLRSYRIVLSEDPASIRSGVGWNVRSVVDAEKLAVAARAGLEMPLSVLVEKKADRSPLLSRFAAGNARLEVVTTKAFLDAWRDEALEHLRLNMTAVVRDELIDLAVAHETDVRRRRRGWAFPVAQFAFVPSVSLMMRRTPLWTVADVMELSDDSRAILRRDENGVRNLTLHDFEHDQKRMIAKVAGVPGTKRRMLDEILEGCSIVADRIRRYQELGYDEAPETAFDAASDILAPLSPMRRRIVEEHFGLDGSQSAITVGVLGSVLVPEPAGPLLRNAVSDLRLPAARVPFDRMVEEQEALIADVLTGGAGWTGMDDAVQRARSLPGLLRLALEVSTLGVRGWLTVHARKVGRNMVLHGSEPPETASAVAKKTYRPVERLASAPPQPKPETTKARAKRELQEVLNRRKAAAKAERAERKIASAAKAAASASWRKPAGKAPTAKDDAGKVGRAAVVAGEASTAAVAKTPPVAAPQAEASVVPYSGPVAYDLTERAYPDDVFDYDFSHVADLTRMTKGLRIALRHRVGRGLPTLRDYVDDREETLAKLRTLPGFGIAKERLLLAAATGLLSGEIEAGTAADMAPPPVPALPERPERPFVATWHPEMEPEPPIRQKLDGFPDPVEEVREERPAWGTGADLAKVPMTDELPMLARVAGLPDGWRTVVEAWYGLDGLGSRRIDVPPVAGARTMSVEDVLAVALLRLASKSGVADARRLVAGRRPPVVDDVWGAEKLALDVLKADAYRGRRVYDYTRPEAVYRY